jgi:putative peptidoglycan lipid II flippase
MSASNPLHRMARSALPVAGMSAVTLALTLAWQLLIARTYGASGQLDAFWIALAVPRAIIESFHFGLLTLLFVLVFHRRDGGGDEDPWRQACAVLNVTLLATLAVIAALFVWSDALTRWMAPGFSRAEAELSAALLRGLAPVLVPTALAATVGGLAIARGTLTPFTLSRAAMPLLQIAVLLMLAGGLGIKVLVWAFWAGAVGCLIVYLPFTRQVRFRYRFTLGLDDPRTRELVRLQVVLAGAWVLISLNQVTARYFATLLGSGSVSALEYAWRFEIPITQIVGLAVALPTFALLARSAGASRREEFRAALAASARLLVLAVLPILGFLVVLREPLARLWFERGAFTGESAALVASLLPALAVVYFCRAFASVLVFGLLITGRVQLLLAGLAVELGLNATLCTVLAPIMGLQGVALASALAMLAVNGWLWSALLRDIGAFEPKRILVHLRPYALAACVSALALEVGRRAINAFGADAPGVAQLASIGAMGVGYLLVYLALCVATGVVVFRLAGGRPQLALRSGEG